MLNGDLDELAATPRRLPRLILEYFPAVIPSVARDLGLPVAAISYGADKNLDPSG